MMRYKSRYIICYIDTDGKKEKREGEKRIPFKIYLLNLNINMDQKERERDRRIHNEISYKTRDN